MLNVNPDEFSSRLRQALSAIGLKQKEAAQRLGISENALSNYVRGRIPEAEILMGIAQLCDVTVEWLLTGRDPPTKGARVDPALGLRIKDALAWAGLTTLDLEERLNVEESVVDDLIEGRVLDPRIIAKIADLTGVSTRWLLDGSGHGPPSHLDLEKRLEQLFDQLIRLICQVVLSQRHDIEAVVRGTKPPSALVPPNGYRYDMLANLQLLLQSPAWKQKASRHHRQKENGSGNLTPPKAHTGQQQSNRSQSITTDFRRTVREVRPDDLAAVDLSELPKNLIRQPRVKIDDPLKPEDSEPPKGRIRQPRRI
ncbi:MAG: helix-turn-helix domain-containing protein [Bacillota bacterium]|nr:helix-turn-helix domain-containing protein [Bacillota bacterium]